MSADDCEVCLKEVVKNNGISQVGIFLRPNDGRTKRTVTAVVYLDSYYKAYGECGNLDEIAAKVYEAASCRASSVLGQECFADFSEVKSGIFFELVNYELNKEMLKTRPYMRFMDLAVIFSFIALNTGDEFGTVRIDNNFLKRYNLSEKELWEIAKENTPELFKASVLSMSEVLCLKNSDEYTENMCVICNEKGISGAAVLLYENVLEGIANKFDSDFFVLPSSIHEVIAVRAPDFMKTTELAKMVKNVNKTVLCGEDVLSESVYYYDRTNKCLKIA